MTEELQQALRELEEEKDKRRHAEEEMNLKARDQDDLKNKLGALMEESSKEKAVLLMGKEAAETSLLVPAFSPPEVEDKLLGGPENEQEKEAALSSHQKQLELLFLSRQEIKQQAISGKPSPELAVDNQLQTLQVQQYDVWLCVDSFIEM